MNKYLEKIAAQAYLRTRYDDSDIHSKFKPDLTPEEMRALGVLEGKYTDGNPIKDNFFHVDASLKEWPESWHNEQHPKGWFQWYGEYSRGKRTDDDERQIKRWISFKARHLGGLKKADPSLLNLDIQPRRRQALLGWGIAPGISRDIIEAKVNAKKNM